MLFRSPWRKAEDLETYAETLGFEEQAHSDLFEAVMKLDRKYRIPILLFYYEGYSTGEIAHILNRREATVRSDLFRARAKLRDILKEAYDFEQ